MSVSELHLIVLFFQAVYTLLLQTEASLKEWYILLADYYQTWCTEPRVKVFNLPYYLQRANLKKRYIKNVELLPFPAQIDVCFAEGLKLK